MRSRQRPFTQVSTRGLSARVAGHLVLLVPGSDPGAAARDAATGLGRMLGVPVTAVGERALSDESDLMTNETATVALAASHRRAAESLSAMRSLGREGQGSTTAELGFVGVLLSEGATSGRFIQDTLGPILDYDDCRGSDLAATLDAWFGQGGHLGRTAGVLHLHPNTVGQRLSRIGKLLGPDWSEPASALQIQMALQLRSLTIPEA